MAKNGGNKGGASGRGPGRRRSTGPSYRRPGGGGGGTGGYTGGTTHKGGDCCPMVAAVRSIRHGQFRKARLYWRLALRSMVA